jgi:DNA-directed RNA polymerase I, II, and III subunit RPABC2
MGDTYSDNGSEQGDYDLEAMEADDELNLATIDLPGIKPELRKLYAQHPELIVDYIETILANVPLKTAQPSTNPESANFDTKHTTYPFLTLYERTRVIGLRANQLSQGARPFVSIPEYMTDVREIARLELEKKRLPFIIQRPLPNGTFEYWRLSDLMIL